MWEDLVNHDVLHAALQRGVVHGSISSTAMISRAQTQSASAAAHGIRARVAPACNLGQSAKVMRPAFRMAGALFGAGQAAMGQAQQRSVRLLDQVDLEI